MSIHAMLAEIDRRNAEAELAETKELLTALALGKAMATGWNDMVARTQAAEARIVAAVNAEPVLAELANAKIVSGCNRGVDCCPVFETKVYEIYVCKKELARRAAGRQ